MVLVSTIANSSSSSSSASSSHSSSDEEVSANRWIPNQEEKNHVGGKPSENDTPLAKKSVLQAMDTEDSFANVGDKFQRRQDAAAEFKFNKQRPGIIHQGLYMLF